jgi:hypothetical protein
MRIVKERSGDFSLSPKAEAAMNTVRSVFPALIAIVATGALGSWSEAAPLPTNVSTMKAMLDRDAVQVRWGGWRGGWGYGGWGYRGWGYRGSGGWPWGAAAAGAIVGGAIASSAYYGGYPYYGGPDVYGSCPPYCGYGVYYQPYYGGYYPGYYVGPDYYYGW